MQIDSFLDHRIIQYVHERPTLQVIFLHIEETFKTKIRDIVHDFLAFTRLAWQYLQQLFIGKVTQRFIGKNTSD